MCCCSCALIALEDKEDGPIAKGFTIIVQPNYRVAAPCTKLSLGCDTDNATSPPLPWIHRYANAKPVPFDRVEHMVTMLQTRRRSDFLLSHDAVASVLQCCALADPPQPDAAVRWFRALVPITHLNDRIEKALSRAIGEVAAQQEIDMLCRTSCTLSMLHYIRSLHDNSASSTEAIPSTTHPHPHVPTLTC